MEVKAGSSKTKGPDHDERLILRCADDEGNFMCFICGDYAPSAKTLYNHLKTSSCQYRWRSVLPKNLFSDCSTVVVCHTLLMDSHSHSSIKLKEEGECSCSKVVADAAPDDSTNVKDRVVIVGKVVHDFDLNELPIME